MKRLVSMILLAVLASSTGCRGDSASNESGSASSGDTAGAATDKMNTVLARVGDYDITAQALYYHMEKTMGPDRAQGALTNPDMLQVGLAALLDQFVWAREAESAGYRLTPAEHAQVDALKAELLATRYVGDVVQHKADPTPEEVRQYYNEHQSEYLTEARVGVKHILVDTRAEAERILKEAKGGAAFGDLVRKYSKDENTRDIGGALGFIQNGKPILGFPGDGKSTTFEDAVLPLEPGDMTVAHSGLGWHVVLCIKREGGEVRSLEDVYDEITLRFRRENFGSVYNEALDQARQKYHASFDLDAIEQFTGVSGNVKRLLAMAKEHPEFSGKVEICRRIVFDYPKARLAPEAQFLIVYYSLKERKVKAARKALGRLQRLYADSPWGAAGKELESYVDGIASEPATDPEPELPTPEEFLARVSE